MAKHDYKGRLNDLTKTIEYLLDDFTQKYNLEIGRHYRVYMDSGKYFDGFFNHLKVSAYMNKLDVWVSFHKTKKDGTPSKVDIGHHMSRIKYITLIPF